MSLGQARRRRSPAAVLLVLLLACGCSGKKKASGATDLSAEGSFRQAYGLLQEHELRQAASAFKRIQFGSETREELEPLTRLALADATYYRGNALGWIDARNLYIDFVTLNGEHPLAPYAQLQVGRCSLNQVSQPTKDQSLTRQAIRDLDEVFRRWPDSRYAVAARSMSRQARSNLAESEFLVGRFYLKRKKYEGAIGRFRNIVSAYPDYPQFEQVLFYLAEAHLGRGNPEEARLFLDRLLTRYPDGAYVPRAQKLMGRLAGSFEGSVDSSTP